MLDNTKNKWFLEILSIYNINPLLSANLILFVYFNLVSQEIASWKSK